MVSATTDSTTYDGECDYGFYYDGECDYGFYYDGECDYGFYYDGECTLTVKGAFVKLFWNCDRTGRNCY
jgi:hypothetical protein